jgi:hypothetical protein
MLTEHLTDRGNKKAYPVTLDKSMLENKIKHASSGEAIGFHSVSDLSA